jgi:hypothetical protein
VESDLRKEMTLLGAGSSSEKALREALFDQQGRQVIVDEEILSWLLGHGLKLTVRM